ncbi:MAG: hypothetical protein KKA79_06575 [Nanoarchaeota archaeon]|nr:hypothetical protein [Nanoarchaeota archaeon]MCG2718496.1 hypothetical protein [Nanoarchaeota archaeon]
MKKEIIAMLFISILLLSPLVYAQTYSGFNRFTDDIKLFFSFGDKKVKFALEIREKEVNSAIENIRNGDDIAAAKNLEKARNKIQLVQKKVSLDVAEEVKISVDKIVDKINEEENLPDDFEVYVLEEEKTHLTAELVIEVEGKEGQTLTREIVKDGESGTNKVEIVVEGGDGQTKIMEIEEKIGEIDNEIKERTFASGTEGIGEPGEDIKTLIVEGDKGNNNGDDGLTPVVKTDVAGGNSGGNNNVDNVVANDDGNEGLAPGTTNEAPGDTVVDGGTNVVEGGDNTVETGSDIDGGDDIDDTTPKSIPFVDVVDEGPGEPGVVDED